MKHLAFPILWTAGFLPLSLLAQAPVGSGFSLETSRPPSAGAAILQFGDPAAQDALPLIPQNSNGSMGAPGFNSSPLPDLPSFDLNTRKPDAPVPSGPNRTEEAAVQMAQRIRFRETKARALASPEVKSALDASRSAKTDRELRSNLRKHYDLLYTKMSTIDPSLTQMIQDQRTLALSTLKQSIGPDKE